jgi:hypothetical protein
MKVKKSKDTGLSCKEERITLNDVWAIFQETDKKIQETERLLRQNRKIIKKLEQDCNMIIGQASVSKP